VADKRQVRRSIKQLQHVKTWQLLVLLILCAFVAATFLRLNSVGMKERRDAVLAADKAGDKEAIKARLYELQRYSATHMNADVGPVYLENQYKRDSQAAITAASSDGDSNGNIYKKAQDVCAPRFTHYSTAYLQCTVDYLNQYSPANQPASTVPLPKADAYRYSFAAPLWSPDFAGFSVLICLLIALMIVARFVGLFILRMMLKIRNR
jgi:hypothetical protein